MTIPSPYSRSTNSIHEVTSIEMRQLWVMARNDDGDPVTSSSCFLGQPPTTLNDYRLAIGRGVVVPSLQCQRINDGSSTTGHY